MGAEFPKVTWRPRMVTWSRKLFMMAGLGSTRKQPTITAHISGISEVLAHLCVCVERHTRQGASKLAL